MLEEQGYITIGDKGIVYHSDCISSQLDQLKMKKMGAEATYGALIFQGLAAAAPEVVGAAGAFAVEVVLPAAIIAGIETVVIATVYIGVTATPSDIPVGLQEARKKGQLAMPGNATKPEVDSRPEGDSEDINKKEQKVGENGVKIPGSKTTGENGKTERVDTENTDPGNGDGNAHYPAPPKIQKVLNEPWFKKAIEKALKYLGED